MFRHIYWLAFVLSGSMKHLWWHWPVLYAGYSMHLLVIKYIAWIQVLCICPYFIIEGKCNESLLHCLVELDLLCMIALRWRDWNDSVPFKKKLFWGYFCFVHYSKVTFDKYAFYYWKPLKCKRKNVLRQCDILFEDVSTSLSYDCLNHCYYCPW